MLCYTQLPISFKESADRHTICVSLHKRQVQVYGNERKLAKLFQNEIFLTIKRFKFFMKIQRIRKKV